MKIVAKKDFIKCINYEVDFLHTEMKMGRAALVAALDRADSAERRYQELIKTLGLAFSGQDWRRPVDIIKLVSGN